MTNCDCCGRAWPKGSLKKASPGKGKNRKHKRKLSAFIVFSNEMRPVLKEEEPDLSFGMVGKRLGEMWRGLSDRQKEDYN